MSRARWCLPVAVACAVLCASAVAQSEESNEGWTWVKAAYKVASKGRLPFVVPVTETGPWRGKKIEEGKLGFECEGGDLRAVTKGGGLAIDVDGDLKADHAIGGKAKPLALKARVDGKVVPYTMVFQSVAAPLNSGTWYYYRTGCYRQAKVGKTRVVLIDGNANGRYGDAEDLMVIGKRTHAQWHSRVINVDGSLMELKVDPDGARVGTKAYDGESGTLDLSKEFTLPKGSKGSLLAAIVKSEDGLSFDGAKATTVPVGSYTLVWGALSAGRKNRCMFKGEIEVEVLAGKVASAPFGGPVKIAAQFSVDDTRRLEVLPDSVFLLGKAKEHYFNFTPSLRPKIEIRDANTKKIIARGGFSAG